MAYQDDESSAYDGDAVELYEFAAVPTATYRYTSDGASHSYGGNTFTPIAGLARSALKAATTASGQQTLDVAMASSAPLALAVAFGIVPRSLRLTVWRKQIVSGDVVQLWIGDVMNVDTVNGMSAFRSTSDLGAVLEKEVPALSTAARCPYALFDVRCGLDRNSYDVATTVSAIADSGRTITVTSDGGNPDEWFANGGEIERTTDGERRIIYTHVGNVVTLERPFSTLNVSDAITMWPGCDHQMRVIFDPFADVVFARGDCYEKFSNAKRFGGESRIPGANPFTLNIRTMPDE